MCRTKPCLSESCAKAAVLKEFSSLSALLPMCADIYYIFFLSIIAIYIEARVQRNEDGIRWLSCEG